MVDSAGVRFVEPPKTLLAISDQIANGPILTAPIDTPRVSVTRTATALKSHTQRGRALAVAVLITYSFL